MELHLLPNTLRIEPPFPVERLISVDGKTLRVTLDWAIISQFLGPGVTDEASVREFLRQHRARIEVAIKAHLFAHGFPMDGKLALSRQDLE